MRWRCSTAARSRRSASSTICRITACSTRSGCSPPARRRGRSVSSGVRLGVPICEDIWTDEVCETLVETGAEMLLVPNGSPFEAEQGRNPAQSRGRAGHRDRPAARLSQPGRRTGRARVRRRILRPQCRPHARLPDAGVRGGRRHHRMGRRDGSWRIEPGDVAPLPDGEEETWQACVLGLTRLCREERFPGVVLGLSGGIDSAVVAAMAVDALGPDRVHCVMMPYRLYEPRKPRGCRSLRQGARRAL